MDDRDLGRAIRTVRIRTRQRQADVAGSAGVTRAAVIDIEAGRIGRIKVDDLRAVTDRLGMRLDIGVRWQGADLDRLLAAGHARMHELLAGLFATHPGWVAIPEVSFAVYGERGVIDLVAWHPATRSLLLVELKTALGDPQLLVATMDRRIRLAAAVVAGRGWRPSTVSAWVLVADTRTNRRREVAHRGLLRTRFPMGGRELRAWLRSPVRTIMALSFLTDVAVKDHTRLIVTPRRVRPTTAELRERAALSGQARGGRDP